MKLHSFAKLSGALGVVMLLAACPLDESQKAPESTTTVTSTADTAEESRVERGLVDVYAQWPTGEYLVDVPVAEDVYLENIMISIDVSGSMGDPCVKDGPAKMTEAKAAATEFLGNIPADAAVGLSIFGDRVGMLVPLARGNHQTVAEAINGLSAKGGTPMSTALEVSHRSLSEAGSAQLGYGKYRLVVLGDGAPKSEPATKEWLDYMAQKTPISVTTIGFCANLSVLDRVGVNYQPASNIDELKAAFASVLAEAESFEDAGF